MMLVLICLMLISSLVLIVTQVAAFLFRVTFRVAFPVTFRVRFLDASPVASAYLSLT